MTRSYGHDLPRYLTVGSCTRGMMGMNEGDDGTHQNVRLLPKRVQFDKEDVHVYRIEGPSSWERRGVRWTGTCW